MGPFGWIVTTTVRVSLRSWIGVLAFFLAMS